MAVESRRALFTFKCKVFIVSNLNEVVHLCIKSNVITLALVHKWALFGVTTSRTEIALPRSDIWYGR